MGNLNPQSNTWFPWLTGVVNPNGISIGAAVLQGSLVWQTDRPTDRPRYSVGSNKRSTAMRTNSIKCVQLVLKAAYDSGYHDKHNRPRDRITSYHLTQRNQIC